LFCFVFFSFSRETEKQLNKKKKQNFVFPLSFTDNDRRGRLSPWIGAGMSFHVRQIPDDLKQGREFALLVGSLAKSREGK
jgi:hypothetical protein